MHQTEISIVIPVWNEAGAIIRVLEDAIEVIGREGWTAELIVVDDGSTDGTAELVQSLSADSEVPVALLRHDANRGYGAALTTGFNHASGELLFFTDGDGQFRFATLPEFVAAIRPGTAVVGYRSRRRDPLHRTLYARTWRALVRRGLGVGCRDINCAYKLFYRRDFQRLATPVAGAGFNADILSQLLALGVELIERPVPHYPRESGTSSGGDLRVAATAFLELLRLAADRLTRPGGADSSDA